MNKLLMRYFVASGTETYEVHEHSAMKYYFCFNNQETNLLENPMAIQGIIQSLEDLKKKKQKNERQIYQNLIDLFLEGKI